MQAAFGYWSRAAVLGHEALFLAQKGFQVSAVDFAAGAIAALKARSQREKIPLQVLERDLFSLAADFDGYFDLVVEHTCFCAIPLERRDEYAKAMAAVLGPEGKMIGLFYETPRQEGPPFCTNKADIVPAFRPLFYHRFYRTTSGFLYKSSG